MLTKLKPCLHCRKIQTTERICPQCNQLPKCQTCTIIMCQNKNHLGRQQYKTDKTCTTCKKPMQILMKNPVVRSILKVYPNIVI